MPYHYGCLSILILFLHSAVVASQYCCCCISCCMLWLLLDLCPEFATRYCGFFPAIHASNSSCVSTMIYSSHTHSDPFRTSGRRRFHKQNSDCLFSSFICLVVYCWCKPHGSWCTRYRIHFHTEMSKTHIMNHIFCINNQFYRFVYHQVHGSPCNINIIMISRIIP